VKYERSCTECWNTVQTSEKIPLVYGSENNQIKKIQNWQQRKIKNKSTIQHLGIPNWQWCYILVQLINKLITLVYYLTRMFYYNSLKYQQWKYILKHVRIAHQWNVYKHNISYELYIVILQKVKHFHVIFG